MNYSQIIKAIPALVELKKMRLPYSIARDIHKMHKTFEAEFQFFAQEEAKLVNEYATKDENGNPRITNEGRVSFENIETKNRYSARIAELGAMDAEIEIPAIKLTSADIGNELISAKTIEALEGVITFE